MFRNRRAPLVNLPLWVWVHMCMRMLFAFGILSSRILHFWSSGRKGRRLGQVALTCIRPVHTWLSR